MSPLQRSMILIAALLAAATASAADMVVIVNKDNPNTIDQKLIADIYSGSIRMWKSGSGIVVYDLPDDSPTRNAFCDGILGRTIANMKALYAQNVFTGKAVPPKQLPSDDEVKKAVAANRNAIGYIRNSSLDSSVKAITSH